MMMTMLRTSRVILLALCLLFASNLRGDRPKAGAAARVESASQITLQRDITYETVDGKPIQLDVAVPAGAGPFPLVICIHGGAWRMGTNPSSRR